ncbi:hypothetical protein Tco_0539779 [Tanacetum coccineum]
MRYRVSKKGSCSGGKVIKCGSVKKKFGHVKSIPQGHGGHENKLKLNIKAGEAAKKQVFKKIINSKPNLKTLVKQKSKDVVISNAPVKQKLHVKPKVGKRKRSDEEVASKGVKDEEGVSDEDVGECVSDEKRDDVGEGDSDEEDEEYEAKENYKDKESEKNVGFESDSESEDEIALKGGKKIKNVSKSKNMKHVPEPESSSEEERVSNPKKHVKRKKHVPAAVNKYLGSSLGDALQKVLQKHTKELIQQSSQK